MPAVGMRRKTRVFGTRILRSGRKLCMEPYAGSKYGKSAHGEGKFMDNIRGMDSWKEFQKSISVFPSQKTKRKEDAHVVVMAETNPGKIFGLVYERKRKRTEETDRDPAEDHRFRIKFARKGWRERRRAVESFFTRRVFLDHVRRSHELCIAIQEPVFGFSHCVARLLFTILRHINRFRIGMRVLCRFLLSKPIFDAYSPVGLHFIEDGSISKSCGVSRISGYSSSVPLLYFTSPVVPSAFILMQTSVYSRNLNSSSLLRSFHVNGDEKIPDFIADEDDDDDDESSSRMPEDRNDDFTEKDSFSNPPLVLSKPVIRSMQLRSSRRIQKRRSFRGGRKFAYRGQKYRGASTTTSKEKIKQQASVAAQPPCCSANLLVTDTDKSYREDGVVISTESTVSERFLVVKKDGMKCYSLKPQGAMRLCSSNRFTHSIVWGETDSWKLEFPCRKDWMNFRDMYTECFKYNNSAAVHPSADAIPVPEVQDVVDPVEDDAFYVPFTRPVSYINVKDDELVRALKNRRSNYDMDSDDERWLADLNGDPSKEAVTPDSFELAIDAFEKAHHCKPPQDDYAACESIARRDAVDAIRNYWIQKRKRKRAALVRVFQLYEPRRSSVAIPKSVLRKKRSFKRQGNKRLITKQCSSPWQEAEQQNNAAEEASAAAERLEEVAIFSRGRAQDMMLNADLRTYKALMAVRIAEAAQV
ncbi:hypothetical protein M569_03969, partial [Genlisea aurea]